MEIKKTIFFVALAIVVGFGLLYLFILSGLSHLLDYSLIVSLVVVEVPLAFFLSYLLGERRRSKLSEVLDLIDLAEKYKHLKLHHWSVASSMFEPYVVENTKTKLAYNCPKYLEPMTDLGVITVVKHKNEKAMRETLTQAGITLVERDANFAELQA